MQDRYWLMGHVYESMSRLYSARGIVHCREAMFDRIKPGDKVLFAGVGHGSDAIAAAQLGAEVTVVELSATMLDKFHGNLAALPDRLPIRAVHGDILAFDEYERYDIVIANFFLNIFDDATMPKVVRHLTRMIRPQGHLVIGDFALPEEGGWLARSFRHLYWYAAVLTFWVVAKNPLHPIYDYRKTLAAHGLKLQDTRHFRLLGMPTFWSLLAQRPA